MGIRKISRALLLAAFASGVCVANQAAALVLLASDNFTYESGALNGRSGGTGWNGAWIAAVNATAIVGAPALDAGNTSMTGGAARITAPVDNNVAYRQLANAVSGNVVIRFDIRFDTGVLNDNDFLGLWLDGVRTGDHTGVPNIGLTVNCGGGCATDLFARTTGTSAGASTTAIVIGQTYALMGYLQKTGASAVYNRISLWVDPTPAEMASLTGADGSYAVASTMTSFDTIGFRSANLAAGSDVLLIDNLAIFRVPEPASLALLGFALLGLSFSMRRRPALEAQRR